MITYSSHAFYREWRYAVEKEFTNSDGQPFSYADDGKRSWGDELKSIKFDTSPSCVAINDDRTLFAVAVERDIHLYNADFEPLSILRGHTGPVSAVAFQPGRPSMLLSSARNHFGDKGPGGIKILFWDLKENASQGRVLDNHDIKKISDDAAESVRDSLAMLKPPFDLLPGAQQILSEAFELPIAQSVARCNVEHCRSIQGYLRIFSPSGKMLIYHQNFLEMKIYSIQEHEDILTLSGHSDIVTCVCYDNSETLIGTASFDQTFRIWDANTGQEKYRFQTGGQNRVASFSPDGKLFCGTSSEGLLHVYLLEDGSKLFQLGLEHDLCSALDWSPDSKTLALGYHSRGKLSLVDVEKKEIVQERVLSTRKIKTDREGIDPAASVFLSISTVKFADQGQKLIFWTCGDASAEAYDLATGMKWRFAREGTESYEDDNTDDNEDADGGDQVSGSYGPMEVWEDSTTSQIMVATVDFDAVRIWPLKMNPEASGLTSAS